MLYEKIKDGQFPRQILLGKRAVGFAESAVNDWIKKLTNGLPDPSSDGGTGK
jgi:predicted DNA-binding transcriptional regulator AlpA